VTAADGAVPAEGGVLVQIEGIAREHVGFEGTLTRDQRLVEDLELDSVKALTLVVEVENLFRIRIEPDDEAEIVTVGDLERVVSAKLGTGGRA